MNGQVITRIAPSPTGPLHVGTVRSALFNYLFAKHHDGLFLLRIEDTDQKRSRPEYEKDIFEGLAWLGLPHDAVMRQSERTDIYTLHLKKLLEQEKAYVSKEPAKEDPSQVVEVIRLRKQSSAVTFEDLIRGEINFDITDLEDFVIARSITEPLYHFAVVVDDAEMNITHVIRGEDHISNTPRQILIQEALGFKRPLYAHLPLILAPNKTKLSKRHGATSLQEYRTDYLPEALLNYLALLGWNPGDEREIFSKKELIDSFDLSKVQKGGAVFDIRKLSYFNEQHIRKLPLERFEAIVLEQLPESFKSSSHFNNDVLKKLLPTLQERITLCGDILQLAKSGELDFYFNKPTYDSSLLLPKDNQDSATLKQHLHMIISMLESIPIDNFTNKRVREAVWDYASKEGRGVVLWPMRVALSGLPKSPDPFSIASIIGKEETLARLLAAIHSVEK